MLGGSFRSVKSVACFDDIQVHFQDSFFTPEQLDQHREIGFQAFADPGAPWPKEDIFRCLLADCTPSA